MSHCHDEHKDVGHDHDHDHDQNDGSGDSLYPYIDTTKLEVENATDPSAWTNPFKPFHERHDRTRPIQSHFADPELIIHIP